MLITTTDKIEGREIAEVLGMVSGSMVNSRHIGSDIGAALKTIVGGEIKGYTKMMEDSRKEAVKRMCEEAERLGADAVVAFRLASSQVMAGASEILAYGTAVKLS